MENSEKAISRKLFKLFTLSAVQISINRQIDVPFDLQVYTSQSADHQENS